MIELRWLEYEAKVLEDELLGGGLSPITRKKLQYRVQISSSFCEENGMKFMRTNWSDWIDVPTVSPSPNP